MDSNENKLNGSQDSAMNLTPEEIEALFAQMQSESATPIPEADLDSLFGSSDVADDLDIQEISQLLNKADNNEAVDSDVIALMKSQEEDGQTAYDAMDLFSGEAVPEKKGFFARLLEGFKQKGAAKKEKTEKESAKSDKKTKKQKRESKKEKKQSEQEVFIEYEKIDEKLAEDAVSNSIDEALTLLMGNNITENIDDVFTEEKESKPIEGGIDFEDEIAEKPKKDKKKKDKKPKEKKVKEQKEKKVKKVKKEKTAHEDDSSIWMDEIPNKKKTFMIFAASIMVMVGFLLVSYFFTGHVKNKRAEEAYEMGDYFECYQLLYDQKRNEEQEIVFHRSEITLKMHRFWNQYTDYVQKDQVLEGADKLVQFVYKYPELSSYASTWSSLDLVEGSYQQAQSILAVEYEVSLQEALDIAGLSSDEDYTRALLKIVQNREENVALEKIYPDILPKEEERIMQNQ